MTASHPWTRLPVATAAGLALLLGACSGGGDDRPDGNPDQTQATAKGTETAPPADDGTTEPVETEAPADEGAAAEPGTRLPLQEGMDRQWPEAVETLTAENEEAGELVLHGVHRLDEERVIVTGRLSLEQFPRHSSLWTEPGYFQGGPRGWEFSAVSLTTAGDDTTYLPVRDERDWCLCSTLNSQSEGETETPVWTVVTAPPGATDVNVAVEGFGTATNVPVTELPTEQPRPLGWAETVLVRSAERQDGQVRVRLAIGNPTGPHTRNLDRYRYSEDWHTTGCFHGLAAWGSQAPTGHAAEDPECTKGAMPDEGEQVELEVLVGDPGTAELVFLPTTGLPIAGVPVTGDPQEGGEPEVYPYRSRTETKGATVAQGETVTVSLDTAVLFEYGEAELTNQADATLAEAVRTLRDQDGRTITVAGHTDSQGSDDFNMELSRDRAQAVARALEADLGNDWTIEVEWHGESQLAVPERGTEQEVEAAQARNRRVEITVE